MERRPGGVEDVAANQGAVTLDRHAAERCAAVVEEPSAHQGAVAADGDVLQPSVPPSLRTPRRRVPALPP